MSKQKPVPKKVIEKNGLVYQLFLNDEQNYPFAWMIDPKTNVELGVPLYQNRFQAINAWIGARHSRSPDTAPEIAFQMGLKGVDADQKLEETFANYGHGSVADMARDMVHFAGVPQWFPLTLFNYGAINSGQEKSTRYQKGLGELDIHDLSHYIKNPHADVQQAYDGLVELAIEHKTSTEKEVHSLLTEIFQPENKRQKRSLESRMFDISRFHILSGQETGFCFETSYRDWSRVISYLKASPLEFNQYMGGLIQNLLVLDTDVENEFGYMVGAPSLVRHSNANPTVVEAKTQLRNHLYSDENFKNLLESSKQNSRLVEPSVLYHDGLPTQKTIAHYIQSEFPELDFSDVMRYLGNFSRMEKAALSHIVFGVHDKYKEMTQEGETQAATFELKGTLGELRDWNRQKAQGRFLQHFPTISSTALSYEFAKTMLNNGFILPAYVEHMEELLPIKESMTSKINEYLDRANEFIDLVKDRQSSDLDFESVRNILPMAQRSTLFLHADPKQIRYSTDLRARGGGHINYRIQAYEMAEVFAQADPFGNGFIIGGKVDPADRDQFFDRS